MLTWTATPTELTYDDMDITNNYPDAFEKVCWEDYDIEDYHKYNEGTEEFLQWLGE